MPISEDERLGQTMRAIRRRLGLSQRQVASLAGIPREDVLAIEDDRAGAVKLDRARRAFHVLDATLKSMVYWRGAALDRLLDEGHARLVETALRVLSRRGWEIASEVTFSYYGERGSVDLLGFHQETRACVIGEVKATIGALEETNRSLDVKVRLGTKICRARFGIQPVHVSRVLIVPEDRTIRRILAAHAATIDAVYPTRSREFRAWLRQPGAPVSALWFLSKVAHDGRIPP